MTKRSGSWHRSADKTKDAEGHRQSMSIRLALTAPNPVRRPRLPVPLNHRPPAVLPPLPRRHGARHVTCRGGRASPAQPPLRRTLPGCPALRFRHRLPPQSPSHTPVWQWQWHHLIYGGYLRSTSRSHRRIGRPFLLSPAPSSLQLAAVQSRPSLTLTLCVAGLQLAAAVACGSIYNKRNK
jgi:hypothetical protein